ncbi:MAG: sugar phosphate nucleotidyltransferase [Phycisphaerales bacterium]|jgi:NDP-sugar pyrophosphorylase family protein
MQAKTLTENRLSEVDVVILCGGMGSRLRVVVDDRPKPMAQINQKPFLDILIDFFSGFGFKRFVLCTGYMSRVIHDYYAPKTGSCQFLISNERAPLGTAGTVKNAEKLIQSDPFLVANGDSFCSVDLAEFYNFHSARQGLMSMVVLESDNTEDCGQVVLDDSQRIISFEEKKQKPRSCHVNAGIYLFQKEVVSFIPEDTKFSLEHELFPELTKQSCYAFVSHGQLIDIGTPERYEWAKRCFSDDE